MKTFEGLTIRQGKKFLSENVSDGVMCPCCNRFAKLYKRPFHSSMARVLIIISKAPTVDGWLHVENYLVSIGSEIKGVHGKLKYWRMLEPQINTDETKAKSGVWRITSLGKAFVSGESTTHKTIYTFADDVYHRSEEQVTIFQALGKKFNYKDLMRA